ncbi:MAG: indolepyruvate ferredoxin oxidoreductase subunit alpha [Candidatus Alkanophagales archaeon]
MAVRVDRYRCGYCGACVTVCPADAIELVGVCIEIKESCNECGVCVDICPVGALALESEGEG